MKIKFQEASKTDVGLVRANNEDELGIFQSEKFALFIVCDGMGGYEGGEVASKIAVQSIVEYIERNIFTTDMNTLIQRAIEYANEKIIYQRELNPMLKDMGTTVVMVLVAEDKCYLAHVGDSRAYLFTNETLHQLTLDHSYVQELVNRGIMTEEEAKKSSMKNRITKALGISKVVEPTISEQPILPQKGDIFLLCSDGLIDMVEDYYIAEILNDKSLSLDQKTAKLINTAKNNGGKDNITVILFEIIESPYQNSVFKSFSQKTLKKSDVDSERTQDSIQVTKEQRILNAKNLVIMVLSLLLLLVTTLYLINIIPKKASNNIPKKALKVVPVTDSTRTKNDIPKRENTKTVLDKKNKQKEIKPNNNQDKNKKKEDSQLNIQPQNESLNQNGSDQSEISLNKSDNSEKSNND